MRVAHLLPLLLLSGCGDLYDFLGQGGRPLKGDDAFQHPAVDPTLGRAHRPGLGDGGAGGRGEPAGRRGPHLRRRSRRADPAPPVGAAAPGHRRVALRAGRLRGVGRRGP
ncbi:MAG: hypothetical protein R3F43_32195 [bacterium]